MRYFIDTNIFLRFYEGNQECIDLIKRIKEESKKYYFHGITLSEIVWVLRGDYGNNKERVVGFLRSILNIRQLKRVDRYFCTKLLDNYEKFKIKYNDCVIYSSMENGDVVVSYDKEFDKLPNIKRLEPKDLLD